MSRRRRAPLTIVVSGMVAATPYHGGATWAVLQYLLGFRELGHDVYFIEPVAAAALQPAGAPLSGSHNAAYFRRVMADYGLEQAAALWLEGTSETEGMSYAQLRQVTRRADVLLNLSGVLKDASLLAPIPLRVYVDLDPAFTQLWQAQGIDMGFAAHNGFVTVGQAIGTPGCPVPTGGLSWMTTLPPVVLARWPVAQRVTYAALTTVANWRGYGSIEHEGVFYGQKAHSLRQHLALPALTGARFVLALAIHPAETHDLNALRDYGWQLRDPAQVAATPDGYQAFIQDSWAEFGIAKSGYVAARCGWFSDRSAAYLASGRPVIAQETGFSAYLPTGAGLFAFRTDDDVLAAVDALRADYPRHAQAARAMAEEHLAAQRVLARLLQQVGAA